MARLWRAAQTVTVHFDRQGRPTAFTWHGQTHQVQFTLQHWEIATDWWSEAGEVQREYFALTTLSGLLCVLYFDLLEQAWYLTRVYD